jgi:HlyD family secretion protein
VRFQLGYWTMWPAAVFVVLGATWALWRNSLPQDSQTHANAVGRNANEDANGASASSNQNTHVRFVTPRRGAMERMSIQVGSVQAESVQLHAKVSGYLKSQAVDIGSRVTQNQVLAVVDVPELEKTVEKNAASVELSRARVAQMKAKVEIAKADRDAAQAQIAQAEASVKSAGAWCTFRAKQYARMKDLFGSKSIDERLVDESKERYEAAIESENAAKAAIITSKAQALSAAAKIQLAEADVGEAEAQVKVARAEHERSQVQMAYARIIAPFDGIVTQRTFFPGDFVRSAGEGGTPMALLTLQRTDRMRVIVQVPDRDVPLTDPGDAAIVEIDAYPGERFPAKVSRIARAEDVQTRLMPIEIDLPNPDGRIRQGMFGKVTIMLDNTSKLLSIPSACLKGKAESNLDVVYVVRDGKAKRIKIKTGADNGQRVEVLNGLDPNDQVVLHSTASLVDDLEVQAARLDEEETHASIQR